MSGIKYVSSCVRVFIVLSLIWTIFIFVVSDVIIYRIRRVAVWFLPLLLPTSLVWFLILRGFIRILVATIGR